MSTAPLRFNDRIPALDSLRGTAILTVFAYHAFFWSGMRTDSWLAEGIALVTRPGWLGVDLFFVLSGFLITGRLLDHGHLSAADFYSWFYTRRALRILPLYFLTLIVVGSAMYWAGKTSLSFIVMSALFMPNIALLAGLTTTYPLAVLWSLGIEEQVYLVWPFLVRSMTIRTLAGFFVALGLMEPVLRYVTFSTGMMREGIAMATWLRLDGFAWGGLLAILSRDVRLRSRLTIIGGGAIISAAAVAALCAWTGHLSRRTGVGSAALFACAALFFAGLVAVALSRPSNAPGRFQRAGAVLGYFGRISYCFYLVHQFAFWTFDRIVSAGQPGLLLGAIGVRAAVVLAVSVAIAELSWRYLEAPSLAVKVSPRLAYVST